MSYFVHGVYNQRGELVATIDVVSFATLMPRLADDLGITDTNHYKYTGKPIWIGHNQAVQIAIETNYSFSIIPYIVD